MNLDSIRGAATSGRRLLVVLLGALATALSFACAPASPAGNDSRAPTDWTKLPAVSHPDPELSRFAERTESYTRICSRQRKDPFAKKLCATGKRPEIRDMAELLELAGLVEDRAFALTANSTSLVTMSVSSINPRIIVFPRVGEDLKPPGDLIIVGFVRGEQFAEVASRDPNSQDLNFYLISFEQKCSYDGHGCDLASLVTEEIEHDWTAYSVYDQDDLEQTTFDCLSCHQPDGNGTKRILRMQELASPWLHWFPQKFVQRTDSDRVLLSQFSDAHKGDKQYGGIALDVITGALDEGSGAQLEALIRSEGFANQPNPFDSQIVNEMKQADQTMGISSTWQARFATHLQGQAIAVPYPRIDVTDEGKRMAAVQAYQAAAHGGGSRGNVVDPRTVFSSDAMEKLSFVPQPGADGKTVLLQMCARCHDGRGNPQLTRNRFDVRKLDEMSHDEKNLAIARINETGVTRMPPWRVGSLGQQGIQAATTELKK